VSIKARPKTPEPPAKPAPTLQLTLPGEVELTAGRTKYIEVQVQTADGSPLPEEPSVTLSGAADHRLRAVPWSSSFKAGQPTCTFGIALTAEARAPAGNRKVGVRVAAAGSTAQRSLKVTVRPSP
jgi:hypothetical protein